MTFDIFGFNILHSDNLYGLWFLIIGDGEDSRAALCLYYSDGDWRIDIGFMAVKR